MPAFSNTRPRDQAHDAAAARRAGVIGARPRRADEPRRPGGRRAARVAGRSASSRSKAAQRSSRSASNHARARVLLLVERLVGSGHRAIRWRRVFQWRRVVATADGDGLARVLPVCYEPPRWTLQHPAGPRHDRDQRHYRPLTVARAPSRPAADGPRATAARALLISIAVAIVFHRARAAVRLDAPRRCTSAALDLRTTRCFAGSRPASTLSRTIRRPGRRTRCWRSTRTSSSRCGRPSRCCWWRASSAR